MRSSAWGPVFLASAALGVGAARARRRGPACERAAPLPQARSWQERQARASGLVAGGAKAPKGRRARGGAPSKSDRKVRSLFTFRQDDGRTYYETRASAVQEGAARRAAGDPDVADDPPSRVVVQADVVQWLRQMGPPGGEGGGLGSGTSVICSLPDVSEMNMTMAEYVRWFGGVVDLAFAALHPGQFAVFYQSDLKTWEGKEACTGWLSKAFLAQQGAARAGATQLWHKIFTFTPAGAPQPMAVGRPGFTHMLCFAMLGQGSAAGACNGYDPKASLAPDVCDRGPQLWNRGAGLQAAHIAVDFLRAQPQTTAVVNLCCGVGTFVAMANALGLDATGVEENASRCSDAMKINVRLEEVLAYRVKSGTLPASRENPQHSSQRRRRQGQGQEQIDKPAATTTHIS